MTTLSQNLLNILKLSRPRFWFYLAGPYLVGFTAGANSLGDFTSVWFWVFLVYFLLIANVLVYGVNDLADEHTDRLNAKKQNQEISINTQDKVFVRRIVWMAGTVSLLLVFALHGWSLLVYLAFIFLAVFYSSPPLRFKGIPFLDFSSNILYILPGLLGYYMITGLWSSVLVLIGACFWAFAMHLFSAIPDIEPDREAGILTTAVYLGRRNSLVLCFVLWLTAWLAILINGVLGVYVLAFVVYPILPLIVLWTKSFKIDKVYWWYPYINTGLGFTLFVLAAMNNLF